ncbi:fungal-specific transcription factor domain-containing protein [Cadophora sp. MPI-SDFR-AT-0126]|nr:fungal-specific transcription factor domain-containing protein [Leotiomycetes sp. MPI-SDFR-AT-0126]
MEAVFRRINQRFPDVCEDIQQKERDDTSEAIEVSRAAPSPENVSTETIPDEDQLSRVRDDLEYIWSFDESLLTPARAAESFPSPLSAIDVTGMLTQITSSNNQFSQEESLLDRILSGDPEYLPDDNNASVWIRTDDGDEYTGPSSGISLLSQPGLTWIRNTFSGTEDICNAINSVTREVANHLQRPKCIVFKPWIATNMNEARKPIPPEDTVWTYVDAYFRSVQCLFPVLDRNSFETRLRTYFQSQKDDSDIAWTALMAAVIASGCRSLLSTETPAAFEKSGSESFAYFQTAINLISYLLYKPASICVVEALLVMTVYAQGLSSPQRLEYTFCALASQVAQGLGLHRKPLHNWDLSDQDMRERNRLFWVTYQLDKTISLRCGRPSVIDDNEISCSFPYGTSIVQMNTVRSAGSQSSDHVVSHQHPKGFDFFFAYTHFARICGKISKELFSASAISRPFSEVAMTARRLESAIEKWREGIPQEFRLGRPFRPSEIPRDTPQIQALSLSFGYHYMICSVHRRFSPMFERPETSTSTSDISQLFGSKYLEAARSMILLTKHLDIESHAPGWMLFYYPITALLGVFTSVVCHPRSGSGNSDIALMEVIVGHLGRLEFMTSGGTAFNKIGELVRLARLVLSRTSQEQVSDSPNKPTSEGNDVALTRSTTKRSRIESSKDSSSHETVKRARTSPQQETPARNGINMPDSSHNTANHSSEPSGQPSQSLGGTIDQSSQALDNSALDFFDCDMDIFASQTHTPSFLRAEERGRSLIPRDSDLHWSVNHGAAEDLSQWKGNGLNVADQSYIQFDSGEVAG